MNPLIIEGILFWFLLALLKLILAVPRQTSLAFRVYKAVTFQLRGRNPEYGISLFQIISIFWLLSGIFLQILGNPEFTGIFGILQFALVYVLPIWIIAGLSRRRNPH